MDNFEHARIADFKNPFPAIDEGFYNLQIVNSEYSESVVGAASPWARYNLRLRIVNDNKFAGRVFFSNQFVGNAFINGLYKVSEATGLAQEDDQDLTQYVQAIIDAGESAVFKAKVSNEVDDYRSTTEETILDDGTIVPPQTVYKNEVKLSSAQVADPFVT